MLKSLLELSMYLSYEIKALVFLPSGVLNQTIA